ncbi:VOC family protein [Mumia sp. zg.B17]|uniref:VOC family protein n=1 Tax=Mumia sp. zg.B17 TaxID=2855446 RepID=UPI0027E2793A|nr:VOC family protein [Mumia sp. zg.B17]
MRGGVPRWVTAFIDQPADSASSALAFWEGVTGTQASPPRGENDEFRTLLPPHGDAYLRLQVVPDGLPRVHLDLHVDDLAAGREAAVREGATITAEPGTHVVLSSPGGMPYCLVPYEGEHEVPAPIAWESGARSVLDQVCLDIPPASYADECRFWAGLTGWTFRDEDTPEFARLVRPEGMPLGILLQRLEDPPAHGAVTAHLDLAGGRDGTDAVADRHKALGADERWRSQGWITLRDPSGRNYCVTRREPPR